MTSLPICGDVGTVVDRVVVVVVGTVVVVVVGVVVITVAAEENNKKSGSFRYDITAAIFSLL